MHGTGKTGCLEARRNSRLTMFVTNRAQRCETHKLALFLVGGRVEVSRAVSVVAILIKNNTARDFER